MFSHVFLGFPFKTRLLTYLSRNTKGKVYGVQTVQSGHSSLTQENFKVPLMNLKELKKKLIQLHISPKKKWGQNFLINDSVSQNIVESIKELKPKKIIEIGPGLGSLTDALSSMSCPLVLIEVDQKLSSFWKKKGFLVISKDALQLSCEQEQFCFGETCTLIGNLPYQIAGSLIVQASTVWHPIESMVLMVQKEVGERILSPCKKKSFSTLSVITQSIWECHSTCTALTTDFYPQPQVEGLILVFKRKAPLPVCPKIFFQFVKECFAYKRKMLKKKLIQKYGENINHIFKILHIGEKARAEEVSAPTYLQLFQKISDLKQKSTSV